MHRLLSILLSFVIFAFCEDVNPIAVITAIEGNVKIYRYTNNEYANATLEQGLFTNDSLITAENSEITLLYNNGKLASFGQNMRFQILPAVDETQRGLEEQDESGDRNTGLSHLFAFSATGERAGLKILVRGEEDSLALKVYEPGNTALVSNKPDVIWSRFNKANLYVVIVQRMGEVIWQKTLADTFLKYPEDVSELMPGSYLLKILAIKGNDTLNSAERFIKVLKPDAVTNLFIAIDNIKKQNPDTFTLHYLSALLYESNGLILNAIKEYESLLKIKPNEPVIHRSLSALYNKYGLVELGNKHLEQYEKLTKGE